MLLTIGAFDSVTIAHRAMCVSHGTSNRQGVRVAHDSGRKLLRKGGERSTVPLSRWPQAPRKAV